MIKTLLLAEFLAPVINLHPVVAKYLHYVHKLCSNDDYMEDTRLFYLPTTNYGGFRLRKTCLRLLERCGLRPRQSMVCCVTILSRKMYFIFQSPTHRVFTEVFNNFEVAKRLFSTGVCYSLL